MVSDIQDLIMETVDSPDSVVDSVPQYACRVCGTDIEMLYAGKGRRPTTCEEHRKNSASRIGAARKTSAKGDVASALAALDMVYNLISMGLLMAGAERALIALNDSKPGLQEKNETYLAQDPKLAKALAGMGAKGGRYAFIGAQVATLGPVAILAYSEISQNNMEKRARKADTAEPEYDNEAPAFVGGIPVAN